MVTIYEPGREEGSEILIEDEEDHDGWGPIRPRRSSMPPDMLADADADQQREKLPVLCTPHPQGLPEKD